MKIVDLHGKEIEVTDLSLALMQADDFRHYKLSGEWNAEFNDRQKAYWQDMYEKLLALSNLIT